MNNKKHRFSEDFISVRSISPKKSRLYKKNRTLKCGTGADLDLVWDKRTPGWAWGPS